MFKCNYCNKITKPHEKCNKLITKEREKEYIIKKKSKRGKEYIDIKRGHEIMEEINLCEFCYKNIKKKEGIKNGKI